jgi:hypothetical protein
VAIAYRQAGRGISASGSYWGDLVLGGGARKHMLRSYFCMNLDGLAAGRGRIALAPRQAPKLAGWAITLKV